MGAQIIVPGNIGNEIEFLPQENNDMDSNEMFPINRNAATDPSGRLAYLNQTDEEHFHIVLLAPTGDEYMRTPLLLIEDLQAIYGSLESWQREVLSEEGDN